uniref:Uncharacterized protein n=1 Tax=Myoviridae sp. ctwmI4 TaxID=2826710 RepID=A0A8S5LUR7_9CAUD|nr:MAG TPA: hypothetical protein [Myoviridae sp. ctwmI4]
MLCLLSHTVCITSNSFYLWLVIALIYNRKSTPYK